MERIYDDNATLVERIMAYVANDEEIKAAALAKVGDHLEECYTWEIDFY
jgi:hypothetical protein